MKQTEFEPWKDEFEMFDMCANKSYDEIKAMIENDENEFIIRQSIRYYLSRHLAFEDNEVDCDITLETDDTMGLSTLQMPCVKKITMDAMEGYIDVYIEGYGHTIDIDDFDPNEALQILKWFES